MTDTAIDPKLVAWARRELRKAGLTSEDPACWFVEYQSDAPGCDHANVEWLGLDPFDALWTAELIAASFHWSRADAERMRQGIGRWRMDSWTDDSGDTCRDRWDHLVIRAVPDPDGGLPLTACI